MEAFLYVLWDLLKTRFVRVFADAIFELVMAVLRSICEHVRSLLAVTPQAVDA
jgi:hypothetical protein